MHIQTSTAQAVNEDDVNDAISLQRTDLGVVRLGFEHQDDHLQPGRGEMLSAGGRLSRPSIRLKERISAQINQSERILQRHFDPALKKPDRPDRLLKSRELAQILRFYLERSLRYGIFDVTAAQEARGLTWNLSSRATRFSSGVAL
jgi:DNA phosphorothioation-dependent restriction protein DptH